MTEKWEYMRVGLFRTIANEAMRQGDSVPGFYGATYAAEQQRLISEAHDQVWTEIQQAGEDGWEMIGPMTVVVDYYLGSPPESTKYVVLKRRIQAN
ncbi:hypothetical protein [Arthrobacter sp. ES3-54]|uniref:hypothetical protein n=1 Tax=Arthrobacter sp. ES3-54 TaxID=1502991 RepID=UPI002405A0A5|nr:hypothetical protein [Arthrobacter sp. ES3-54]MDF9749190.1 hypothetical protein [Arthrobacter sp. ES3-54]